MRVADVIRLLLIVLLALQLATSQSTDWTISGIVLDPGGRAISGTEIIIINDGTGISYSAATKSEGICAIADLPPGSHRALDYSRFGGASHEKIWTKMYGYRSAIAQGRKPDFKTQLALLKTADAANDLVRDTVQKTIRHAYAEPQLVADLHNV